MSSDDGEKGDQSGEISLRVRHSHHHERRGQGSDNENSGELPGTVEPLSDEVAVTRQPHLVGQLLA